MRKMSSLDLPDSAQAGIRDANPFPAEYGTWWIDSTGAKLEYVDVPDDAVPGEADSLMTLSKRILDSKKRSRIATATEAAWRRDMERNGLSEARLQAEWIAGNLVLRSDFRATP
jgi:hypothetical protein